MSVVATIMAFIYSFIGLGMSIGMATGVAARPLPPAAGHKLLSFHNSCAKASFGSRVGTSASS